MIDTAQLRDVLRFLDALFVVYFLLMNLAYAALLVSATVEMVVHKLRIWGESRSRTLGSAVSPSISILAPAHNEEASIAESITGLLALHYANLEVVVINDGSSDRTLDVLTSRFGLTPIHPVVWKRIETKPVRGLYRSRAHPNLLVVDKENGRKADATNAGLNMATGDLVCVVDADTVLDPDALQRLARPFLSDARVVAAGGTIRLTNGSTVEGGRIIDAQVPLNFIAGMQVVEYSRAFLFGRLGWNRLGGNLIVSGALGLFRRDAMIAVGGFTHDTIGEDMELIIKMRRGAYEARRQHAIAFVPDAVAWTEAPETLRVLGGQRDRWQRGLVDVLWRHRRLFLNPRYGLVGLFCVPFFFFVELLAPLVELAGWVALVLSVALGVFDRWVAGLFFLVAYGGGVFLSYYALVLEEWSFGRYGRLRDRFLLMGFVLIEAFGYRQLSTVWRIRGMWKYFRGRTDWGKMERRGFARPAASSAPGIRVAATTLACALAAMVFAPQAARAQAAPQRAWTTVELRAGLDALSGDYPRWTEQELRVDHRVTNRTGVGLSAARVSRFARDDRRLSLDASAAVGSRVTLGADAEWSPTHAVVAREGAEARVYASLGGGWGVQVAGGQRRFAAVRVTRGTATMERYWGRWLASYAASAGRLSNAASTSTHALRLSRFLFDRSAVSLGLYAGRDVENVGDAGVSVMRVRAGALWGDVPLTSRCALTYQGSVTRQGDLYVRRGFSLGVRARFE